MCGFSFSLSTESRKLVKPFQVSFIYGDGFFLCWCLLHPYMCVFLKTTKNANCFFFLFSRLSGNAKESSWFFNDVRDRFVSSCGGTPLLFAWLPPRIVAGPSPPFLGHVISLHPSRDCVLSTSGIVSNGIIVWRRTLKHDEIRNQNASFGRWP